MITGVQVQTCVTSSLLLTTVGLRLLLPLGRVHSSVADGLGEDVLYTQAKLLRTRRRETLAPRSPPDDAISSTKLQSKCT